MNGNEMKWRVDELLMPPPPLKSKTFHIAEWLVIGFQPSSLPSTLLHQFLHLFILSQRQLEGLNWVVWWFVAGVKTYNQQSATHSQREWSEGAAKGSHQTINSTKLLHCRQSNSIQLINQLNCRSLLPFIPEYYNSTVVDQWIIKLP